MQISSVMNKNLLFRANSFKEAVSYFERNNLYIHNGLISMGKVYKLFLYNIPVKWVPIWYKLLTSKESIAIFKILDIIYARSEFETDLFYQFALIDPSNISMIVLSDENITDITEGCIDFTDKFKKILYKCQTDSYRAFNNDIKDYYAANVFFLNITLVNSDFEKGNMNCWYPLFAYLISDILKTNKVENILILNENRDIASIIESLRKQIGLSNLEYEFLRYTDKKSCLKIAKQDWKVNLSSTAS